MSNTVVLRPVGQTVAIGLTSTSSTAVTVKANKTNDQCNYAAFLNPGSKGCSVAIAPSSAPAAVIPTAGTPADFYLPPLMTQPVVLAVPANQFSVTGICAATETTTIYVTPVGDQS